MPGVPPSEFLCFSLLLIKPMKYQHFHPIDCARCAPRSAPSYSFLGKSEKCASSAIKMCSCAPQVRLMLLNTFNFSLLLIKPMKYQHYQFQNQAKTMLFP